MEIKILSGIWENENEQVKPTRTANIGINLVDIFKNTTESDSTSLLEIDRFKAKIIEIWTKMLEETYAQYYDEDSEDS